MRKWLLLLQKLHFWSEEKNKSFAAQMQQRKNHQNWKIFQDSISVVCYDDSDAQLFPSLSNSCKSKFLPFGAAVLKLGELGVSTQCILLTLCGSSTALLPGPLTSTEVTQKSGWVCLDRGTHGSSWHFHISSFKSILNVKSAQFSVTKEIIDTSHSDRLNSHSCYLLLPQFTKWL